MKEHDAAPAAGGTMAVDAAAAVVVSLGRFLSSASCVLVSFSERGKRRSETARLRTRLK